ncbi:helix-turn-helix domain-containing protein [Streptomyces sp. SM12]|uniref:AlbA family DNA-binding domain-containing protein n=1 Tax=Streptomyces sp. SM12 TaxID=1071602 RepID=UPI000CD5C8A9|nr:ATP-binding protein [Streptomyces sp. SM12]
MTNHQTRWTPRTEVELQAAIDNRTLEESAYLDFKRELPHGSKANRGIARDIAAFALNGGALVVGVDEDKPTGTFALAPQPLNGLAERIEQIAGTVPDPPVHIRTEAIPAAGPDGAGYLIVHIPPSPDAPHMVEGLYPARGDKTNSHLTDAQVSELHLRRRATSETALTWLRTEMATDPLRDVSDQSHLYLVARPTSVRRDACLPLTSDPARLTEILKAAVTDQVLKALVEGRSYEPDMTDLLRASVQRRAGGVARVTSGLRSDRSYDSDARDGAERTLELQLHENGELTMLMTRLSTPGRVRGEQVLHDEGAVRLTHQLLALVRQVADEISYRGSWALAAGASELRGRRVEVTETGYPGQHRYSADNYEESTLATHIELHDGAGRIARRLLGPLLRSLGTESSYRTELSLPRVGEGR